MKYKSIIPLVISLLLLLGACAPSHPSESSDTLTPSESVESSTEPVASVPEGTALDETELDALREFFGDANNWNSQILASGEFYGVENIDLYLFSNAEFRSARRRGRPMQTSAHITFPSRITAKPLTFSVCPSPRWTKSRANI